jgi:pimeloyl-ACP methyl ester carboxylesterase
MTRWILLRGLTREVAHWGTFPQELARRLGEGHTVQPIDLPGAGTLHKDRCPANVGAMAEACRTQAGPGDPVVLVALSLGAMVALEWCRSAPGTVAGCALVNTSAGGHSPWWDRLRPAHYLDVLRMGAPGLPIGERERQILAMTSAVPARHAGLADCWERIATERPVSRGNALRQLLAAARYRAPATPPPVPGLLLASHGDGLVAMRCSQRLASAWHWPLATHPWAGHDLPLDDPRWVIDALDRWRRSVI